MSRKEEYVWAEGEQGGLLHAVSEDQVATVQEAFCGYDPKRPWGRTDLLDPNQEWCSECVGLTVHARDVTVAANRAVAKLDRTPKGVTAEDILSPKSIDARVMARLRAPFTCELIASRGTDPGFGRWRISDANDDAVASCSHLEEGYARLIVQALNEHFERRQK
jgi:hypothetical protein